MVVNQGAYSVVVSCLGQSGSIVGHTQPSVFILTRSLFTTVEIANTTGGGGGGSIRRGGDAIILVYP